MPEASSFLASAREFERLVRCKWGGWDLDLDVFFKKNSDFDHILQVGLTTCSTGHGQLNTWKGLPTCRVRVP